ncbi:hypothetical protein EHQ53_03995 [Leptospira langatensis]|uniref:Uncharacterized protein n=1 Tax=Leptospira langatensis TaxID=2484983 RepID=A0A5F1ZXW0_9LEPT|nr:hypothetical protein [Leptospira langatensis]TGJ99989.1 hypothetical protein EHO57_11860 [Leptospira langatensis]TGL42626.1 hypothetical protein EHQ53_03995 [Leptospira langatensis]
MDWDKIWEQIQEEVIAFIIGGIVTYIIYFLAKQTKPNRIGEKIVLRLPTLYWYLAIILLFALPIILLADSYSLFKQNGKFILPNQMMFYIIIPLMFVALFLIFYCKNHEIILGKDSIVSYGLTRKRKEIQWKSISKVQFQQGSFRVYELKKHIEITSYLAGFAIFLEHLKKYVSTDLSEEAFRKYEKFLKNS